MPAIESAFSGPLNANIADALAAALSPSASNPFAVLAGNTFTAQQKHTFAAGTPIYIGAGTPVEGGGVVSGMTVTSATTAVGWHGFRDEAAINLTGATINNAYASYDAAPVISGTSSYDHFKAIQARPTFNSSGTLDTFNVFDAAATHDGGTLANARGMFISDFGGAGAITVDTGLLIGAIVRGATNYSIYTSGGDVSFNDNRNGTLYGPRTINANSGQSSIAAGIWGEDASTKYISLLTFSTNSTVGTPLSARLLLQSGMTGGLNFNVIPNAPITFDTSNTTRLTLDGSGNFTSAVNVKTPFLDLFSGSGACMRLPISTSASGFNNYIRWHRDSDGWEGVRIGQNYSGSSDYRARLVFGVNKGGSINDIAEVLSLSHNGTNAIINMAGLPTSSAGLATGDLYVDTGVLKVA